MKNMTGAIYVAGPLDYETRRRVSRLDAADIYLVTGDIEQEEYLVWGILE